MAGWAARTGYELVTLIPGVETSDPRPRSQPALLAGDAEATSHPLRTRMAALLAESAELGRDEARRRLYDAVVRSLVPDEARVLQLLAHGERYPTTDVVESTFLGGGDRVVVRNASTVGRAAGVTLTDAVPVYVTRLVAFGLAELGPEDRTLSTQYEVLVADETVVAAARTLRRPRFVRGTVRISRFGTSLWQACSPKPPEAEIPATP